MDESYVSKTARKREALELQALGQTLAGLKRAQLETLPLPDKLAQALFDYQRFTTHEARRRQMQFIGRLMRDLDTAPIVEALATLRGESADARYRQHEAEHWRDRLIAEPEMLTAFIETYPDCDRQAVRQALTRARKPAGEVETRTAHRALFRILREQIPEA
ncbi:MAG: ribosome biogenesis factor YjgA [Pseudomonadales bacterium]|jgi:ribosome-associated protein